MSEKVKTRNETEESLAKAFGIPIFNRGATPLEVEDQGIKISGTARIDYLWVATIRYWPLIVTVALAHFGEWPNSRSVNRGVLFVHDGESQLLGRNPLRSITLPETDRVGEALQHINLLSPEVDIVPDEPIPNIFIKVYAGNGSSSLSFGGRIEDPSLIQLRDGLLASIEDIRRSYNDSELEVFFNRGPHR